jgi:hypothetical protein
MSPPPRRRQASIKTPQGGNGADSQSFEYGAFSVGPESGTNYVRGPKLFQPFTFARHERQKPALPQERPHVSLQN